MFTLLSGFGRNPCTLVYSFHDVSPALSACAGQKSLPLIRQAICDETADVWARLAAPHGRTMPRPDSSVVERGPEKAGVGGSIPSLATILFNKIRIRARNRRPDSARDWFFGGVFSCV